MRFLLINNHCISDPTAGVTQSLRTIIEWLADAGHECRILTTSRFEGRVGFTIDEHLRQQGVAPAADAAVVAGSRRDRRGQPHPPRAVVDYDVRGVPVRLLMTRHHDESKPHAREAAHYLTLFRQLLVDFTPDQVIACNGHPMIFAALAEARQRGITTAYAVRGYGYYHPRFFADVDHVFTCSRFLTDVYEEKLGLVSTPLEPPIDWRTVVAPAETRAFVTFVHPSPHKGLFLFARLADMLGARRSDIPVLVVQSGHTAGALNAIAGLDFSRYPQIMAAPAVPTPSEYFALTRILLVPSVWDEPFGRVAAEAMINGIPPVVSDRGSLPHVVGGDAATGGGGCVVPVPPWMTPDTTRLPSEAEITPWYEAICALWDDPAHYHAVAARARQIAAERYSERVSRQAHVEYFTSLTPRGQPLPAAPAPRSSTRTSIARAVPSTRR